ncbi:hypothetical protein GHK33_20475 [Sinorhizobium meliloti]|uniref:Uncharacterized protein n=1 Tax=Rhizobium meliloti TaxID=382 RepID=A0A6A7ZUZ0_RHIML|nr:hypothetical protein [Sinorhizobium meliloti]MDW9376801.1 hypothetical protein [Sinorhizobium meliloti]MDW9495387.1 hypothetical protein [Sinorhizobium meliloti]MDW9563742.1 hypothetical protein [Sinorhizobium meliloti]MDW9651124.1 hypothetical protein [Sinorhizobium meliloti]MDW9861626.1 hypothetical protein [Sinorhizobium meliloti]
MADLSINSALVVGGTNSTRDTGTAGETITAGQAIFLSSTTNKWLLSDNNGAGTRTVHGIALNGASLDQPVSIHKSGDITVGATLVAGTDYWLSGTAGGICPRADLVAGMDTIQIGIAKSTTVLSVDIQDPGVTLA